MIPTDPLSATIFGITLVIDLLSINDGYTRVREGIAARAQKEGRDVTPEEEQLLDAMLAESEKARDGQ